MAENWKEVREIAKAKVAELSAKELNKKLKARLEQKRRMKGQSKDYPRLSDEPAGAVYE